LVLTEVLLGRAGGARLDLLSVAGLGFVCGCWLGVAGSCFGSWSCVPFGACLAPLWLVWGFAVGGWSVRRFSLVTGFACCCWVLTRLVGLWVSSLVGGVNGLPVLIAIVPRVSRVCNGSVASVDKCSKSIFGRVFCQRSSLCWMSGGRGRSSSSSSFVWRLWVMALAGWVGVGVGLLGLWS
jgi:hypothetical protein